MAGVETLADVPESRENDDSDLTQSEKTERVVKLPLTRIKHIMKMDPDVTLASQDAVVMIAKATELFIQEISKEAYIFTSQSKRKTVQRKDLGTLES
ncbi:hypothetical protein LSH36_209g05064 [Paralvinella palmiformis]|uniref:Transcription factor CBF/NF-Y/archaeal histone domain-containing protein n=1 Tax=Paralvinella palmiformis TaxID=53620 RepID=A0AAD9JQ77_9ANNE|nr:hypothetical protein LSH36_209g05064 [Paralvinella palmiformis]